MSNIDHKLNTALNIINLQLSDQNYQEMLILMNKYLSDMEHIYEDFIWGFNIQKSDKIIYSILDIKRNRFYNINYENLPHDYTNILEMEHNCNLIKILKSK